MGEVQNVLSRVLIAQGSKTSETFRQIGEMCLGFRV